MFGVYGSIIKGWRCSISKIVMGRNCFQPIFSASCGLLDSSFLFSIPQKLSNSTLSIPWIQCITICTSFSFEEPDWSRTSLATTRTPKATSSGTESTLEEEPSCPANFICFRRACLDQTFSAANPTPALRDWSHFQNQRSDSSSLSIDFVALSMEISLGSVKL